VIIALNQYLGHGKPLYMLLYAAGIVFFSFFYTAVVFNPEETAENLKRNGGFIPGIRPGKNTENYLDYVLTRITVLGAGYITFVCVVPEWIMAETGMGAVLWRHQPADCGQRDGRYHHADQSHLYAHQYGDLIKKAKLKGRLR
jgi:preprotein translocase subunit SecY